MSINLTDEIEVKTKKGKLGAAKQIFLEGDMQNVEKEIQNINSRHSALNTKYESLSRTVQGIAATGGASTANNVTYNNDSSGLNAENAQDAIDELVKLLKAEFSYKGIAQPTTNPGVPDRNVFYIAGEGSYPNFNNQVVEVGQIAVLKWDGSWHKEVLEIGADGGNKILEWNTDFATTRKQVPLKKRKAGMQISYLHPDFGWVNEQYAGTLFTDTEWCNDVNWKPVVSNQQIKNLVPSLSRITDSNYIGGNVSEGSLNSYTQDGIYALNGDKFQQNGLLKKVYIGAYNNNDLKLLIVKVDDDLQFTIRRKFNITTKKGYYWYDLNEAIKVEAGEQIAIQIDDYITNNLLRNSNAKYGTLIKYPGTKENIFDATSVVEKFSIGYEIIFEPYSELTSLKNEVSNFQHEVSVIKETTSDIQTDIDMFTQEPTEEYIDGYEPNVTGSSNFAAIAVSLPQSYDYIVTKVQYKGSATTESKITLLTGIIDARGWFIESGRVACHVEKNVTNGVVDVIADDILICPKDNIVFIAQSEGSTLNFRIAARTSFPIYISSSIYLLSSQAVTNANYDISVKIFGKIDRRFAKQEDLNVLEERVVETEKNSVKSNILKDRVTGEKYKIAVTNGSISVIPLKATNILIVGNSFSKLTKSEIWQVTRGCAATVDSCQYVVMLSKLLGATYKLAEGGAAFERASTTQDIKDISSYITFDKETYDLVIIQLGENATGINSSNQYFQKNIEKLYDYLITENANANFIHIIGWSSKTRDNFILSAAEKKAVTVINCNNETYTGNSRANDYLLDGNGDYVPFNGGVVTHPSDVGMALIANKIALNLGSDSEIPLYNLNINNTEGGLLTTAYNKWVAGGIVSIKCEPVQGYNIETISVDKSGTPIETVRKENNGSVYYCFIMPEEPVNITGTWRLLI